MSRLGFHVSAGKHSVPGRKDEPSFGLGDALKQCADAGSPVPVIFSLDQNIWPDVQKFSPKTVVVFRTQKTTKNKSIGDGPGSMYKSDPVKTAQDWMALMMPVWRLNKAHYYAPLNEQDPSTLTDFRWLNAFTLECMNVAEKNGFKLGLFAFSGGNPKNLLCPDGSVQSTVEQCWHELLPSLTCAKANGHILLLHEYGFDMGTLRNSVQGHLALRYRTAYACLPPEARPPLVISEASAGVGYAGISPDVWLDDAKWYDSELLKDPYVIGCCLYQLGGAENFCNLLPKLTDIICASVTPVPDVVPPVAGEKYRVVCDLLNVHFLPSLSSQAVGALFQGREFLVTEKRMADGCEWGRLNFGWTILRVISEALTEKVG